MCNIASHTQTRKVLRVLTTCGLFIVSSGQDPSRVRKLDVL
jgi:hypothetical protein